MPADNDQPAPTHPSDEGQLLRRRAEEALSAHDAGQLGALSLEEIRLLLHELRVHQIELELQNEELRRAQAELEASRNRYFELYDLAPVGYVTLSDRGMIKEANLTVAAILQVPRSTLLGWPLTRFMPTSDQEVYYQHHRQLASTGAPQVCELQMLRSNQTALWARLETSVSPTVAGRPLVYRMAISDITARVQAEEALRDFNTKLEERVAAQTTALREREGYLRRANAELAEALRLKDEFLAMMSHELRTPLNIILGISEALSEQIYGPLAESQRQALARLEQSGRHLLNLISDILDLARIAAGRAALDLQVVEVDTLCQTALLFVVSAAEAKGVHVEHTSPPANTSLYADERRLTQVLVNLLSNAVKFTPAGGTIGLDVTADADQERVQFSVWDTGIGIAEADMPRLFEPFTQVDGGLSRQYEGAGLGLTLVRRLTELHGGSVSLESAPGQGSRFTVSLPWQAQDHTRPELAETPEVALPAWSRPPRVVLVDDHAPTLALYADLLSRRGCDVAVAGTGEEALAQVRAGHPDVVVLDIQMPGMDGLTALRHLRADPAHSALPVIALTALVMPGDRERCLAAGASAYLAKPVRLRALLATIAALLPVVRAEPERPGG